MASDDGSWKSGDWYTCVYCKKNFPSKTECSSHRRKEHHKPIRVIQHRVKSPILIILDDDEEEGDERDEPGEKQQQQQQHHQESESGGPENFVLADDNQTEISRSEVTVAQYSKGDESVERETSVKESFNQGQGSSLSHPVKPPLENKGQNPGQGHGQHEKGPEQSGPHQTPELGGIVQKVADNEGQSRVLRPRGCKQKKFEGSNESPRSKDESRKRTGKNVKKSDTRKTTSTALVIPGHVRIHEMEEGKLLYECTVCKKSFKTKFNVKYHEFCLNPGGRPLTCGECGVKFISQSHLNYHLLVHTGERPFKCVETGCTAAFCQKTRLKRHMRTHTGEIRYSCFLCSKKFCTRQSAKQHMLIHTGERRYVCKHCDKRFTCLTNLRKHILTHTGEKPWSCSTCGKSFGLKWSRDFHMRTHQRHLYDHRCDVCGRTFASQKDIRRHSMIHTGERPFRCPKCPVTFKRQDNMRRHVEIVHDPKNPRNWRLNLVDSQKNNNTQGQRSKAREDVNDEIGGQINEVESLPNTVQGTDKTNNGESSHNFMAGLKQVQEPKELDEQRSNIYTNFSIESLLNTVQRNEGNFTEGSGSKPVPVSRSSSATMSMKLSELTPVTYTNYSIKSLLNPVERNKADGAHKKNNNHVNYNFIVGPKEPFKVTNLVHHPGSLNIPGPVQCPVYQQL